MPEPAATSHAFWRLKLLRETQGITLEELAARSGLTKSYLSKVERGVSVPSIATALKLADAFGIGVGELFGAGGERRDYTLVRRGERQRLNRRGEAAGHRYEAIALAGTRGLLEAFSDRPPFETPPDYRPAEHRGHELLFVLTGRISVDLAGETLRLAAGDALMFDGRLPHRVLSLPPRPAEILVIVTAGEAGGR